MGRPSSQEDVVVDARIHTHSIRQLLLCCWSLGDSSGTPVGPSASATGALQSPHTFGPPETASPCARPRMRMPGKNDIMWYIRPRHNVFRATSASLTRCKVSVWYTQVHLHQTSMDCVHHIPRIGVYYCIAPRSARYVYGCLQDHKNSVVCMTTGMTGSSMRQT